MDSTAQNLVTLFLENTTLQLHTHPFSVVTVPPNSVVYKSLQDLLSAPSGQSIVVSRAVLNDITLRLHQRTLIKTQPTKGQA